MQCALRRHLIIAWSILGLYIRIVIIYSCVCVCVTCYDMIPSRNMFVYEYIIFAKINILCYGGKTIH